VTLYSFSIQVIKNHTINHRIKFFTLSLFLISQHFQIQSFHSLPCPRGFSQEFQTGINRRIVGKASDVDPLTEFFPAIEAHQIGYDIGKCYSMERVFGLRFSVGFQFILQGCRSIILLIQS